MEKTRLRIFILWLTVAVAIILPAPLYAAPGKLLVEVIDSVSGEPVPFTAIYVKNTTQGAMADEDGRAWLTINAPRAELEFSAMGYAKRTETVGRQVAAIRVMLVPAGHQLEEVTVRRRKEHYSKRNNPAVDFARLSVMQTRLPTREGETITASPVMSVSLSDLTRSIWRRRMGMGNHPASPENLTS